MVNPALEGGTAADILDIAERLVQTRGFNGFSCADVATEMGITKAALHYHFPGKAQLGYGLITRYADRFYAALAEIVDRPDPASERLASYCDIYRVTLRSERMCLCGMVAAEYNTLGEPMRDAIRLFFDQNRAWLSALLDAGPAQTIIAALERAMLVAVPLQSSAVMDVVIDRLLADFRSM